MLRKLFFTVAAVWAFVCLEAQQLPQYTLYSLTPYTFNAAYAGIEPSLRLTAIHRSQWVGLEGAPTTQMIAAHMPLYVTGGGVGMMVENDELGASRFLNIRTSYNHMVSFSEKSKISLGVRAGYAQRSFDGSLLYTPDGTRPSDPDPHVLRDDLLDLADNKAWAFTLGVGIYAQFNRWEIGFAAENLQEPTLDYGFSDRSDFLLSRHFFTTLSYNFYTGEAVQWKPTLMLMSDGVQTKTDFSIRALYKGTFFAGIGVRGYDAATMDALLTFLGLQWTNGISVAYGFDLPLSDLRDAHSGSHEVMVSYRMNKPIGKGKKPPVIYNPRFL